MNMNDGKRMTYTNANGINGLSSLYGNATDTMTKSKSHWNHLFLINVRQRVRCEPSRVSFMMSSKYRGAMEIRAHRAIGATLIWHTEGA